MFKRGIAVILLLAGITTAWAGRFYVGPTLVYQSIATSSVTSSRYQSINPRLSLGYGDWIKEWLYLGVEATGSPRTIVVNNEPKNNQSLKDRSIYGLGVIPGIYLDQLVMGYARIGGVTSHFEQLGTSRKGFALGLGLETKVTDNWALRAEYDYVKYNNITGVGSPRADEFAVGGVYRFGC